MFNAVGQSILVLHFIFSYIQSRASCSFRDGQQSRAPYTVKQMVDIYKLIARLGGPKGIIRQSEFFVYTKKDREALLRCMDLGYKFPEATTWIRAKKEDFQLVRDIGIKETGILVSCSDYHIFKKMKMTRSQALNHYLAAVSDAFDAGVIPRCHLEDITRADFYGFVVPFVNELQKLSQEAGIPVKIRACDTMGYGVPYTEVALPRSVAGIIYGLQHYSDVPSEHLEWHGHNDFHMAVANASTAWLYGACAVNCSLLGIGERTGNIPLEAMVFEYAALRGSMDGMDPTVITEIARYYEKELGYDIPKMTPFIGENFNQTRAGIHADGLIKDEEIYNIFNTDKILNRPIAVVITATSGLAGIALWLNQHQELTGGEIAAMAVTDAICRMVPGVLADPECFEDESHFNGMLEYPQYSRPAVWHGREVPSILLSGNHGNVAKWRRKQSIRRTRERRPDMYELLDLSSKQDKKLLKEMEAEDAAK